MFNTIAGFNREGVFFIGKIPNAKALLDFNRQKVLEKNAEDGEQSLKCMVTFAFNAANPFTS